MLRSRYVDQGEGLSRSSSMSN